ncbi:MAG TPA: hypothetical protein ENK17_05470 [Anaerolineae bacterium]|nr:hypothetical protein [Anaerolineae bacterium]
MDVPPAWNRITISALEGVVLIVGATDTGKSTFARYLYRRLYEHHERVAFVDGDVGQATLGPPTTLTLALGEPGDDAFPPAGVRYRMFVGATSPYRHMLPLVVGAQRLVEKARAEGATAIVYDTTGLVDPAHGGGELKMALVNLLRPSAVVGIQRRSELEYLLLPLRRSRRTRVIDLRAAPAAQRRDMSTRREYRAAQFRRYFQDARPLRLPHNRFAVFPSPQFAFRRLLALEDQEGFALALGIVTGGDLGAGWVTVLTPLPSLEGVDAVHLGDLALSPQTFTKPEEGV